MKKVLIILFLFFASTFCYSQKVKTIITVDKKIEWKIKTKKKVFESFESHYELFDSKGNLVKKGDGKYIDCKELENGLYYLNYADVIGEVINLK